jgi:hypothetical protein
MSSTFNIPAGYALVPIEPTREMLDAYCNQDGKFQSARSDWRAMLAAAPTLPVDAVPGEPVAPFGWYGEAKFENGFTTDARVREMWEANGRRITPLHAIAPAAAAEPSESPWFGVEDEVSLTRAVSVMNDVLTDISGWEDRALAEAIESSKVDLCAMIECIRMRADDSYVPGSKPIDGEAVPIIPDRERAASLVASEDTKRLDFLQAWADKSIAQGFKWDNYVFTNDVPIREQLDTARAIAGEAQS